MLIFTLLNHLKLSNSDICTDEKIRPNMQKVGWEVL